MAFPRRRVMSSSSFTSSTGLFRNVVQEPPLIGQSNRGPASSG